MKTCVWQQNGKLDIIFCPHWSTLALCCTDGYVRLCFFFSEALYGQEKTQKRNIEHPYALPSLW